MTDLILFEEVVMSIKLFCNYLISIFMGEIFDRLVIDVYLGTRICRVSKNGNIKTVISMNFII